MKNYSKTIKNVKSFSQYLLPSSSHVYQTRRGSSNVLDVTINAIVASKILELLY